MKQRLIIALTLLLLAFHFPLLAQPYRQLPLNGARWKINYIHKNFPIDQGSFFMTTSGDTTIAGLAATRILTGQAAACSGAAFAFHTVPFNYIHQDSLGRVYSIRPNGQMTKLYDLGLQVGDTMQTTDFHLNPVTYRVDSIDTLTFADGIPRKALHASANSPSAVAFYAPVIWVEGIGDIYHGPIPVMGISSYNDAGCYQEAERVLVTNLYTSIACINDCDRLVALVPPLAGPSAAVLSPHPAHDQLRLTHTDAQPLHVRLMALDGRALGTWDLDAAPTHTLQLPAAPPGLYLLELRDSEGRRLTQRLVLE